MRWRRLQALVLWLSLALLFLLPRVLDLGLFVTHDEAEFWLRRSKLFLQALQAGDPAGTAITPHPGVTTMWLGALGTLVREELLRAGILPTDSFVLLLASARLAVVLMHTAILLVAFALLRRLIWLPIAMLAAVFWATDPFFVAYSRLLHVDALLSSGVLLSLLALASWLHSPHHRPHWLALAAVGAAFAVLSKSPGIILLPFSLLVIGVLRWQERCGRQWLRQAGADALIWGGVYLGVLLLLYPALWLRRCRCLNCSRWG